MDGFHEILKKIMKDTDVKCQERRNLMIDKNTFFKLKQLTELYKDQGLKIEIDFSELGMLLRGTLNERVLPYNEYFRFRMFYTYEQLFETACSTEVIVEHFKDTLFRKYADYKKQETIEVKEGD